MNPLHHSPSHRHWRLPVLSIAVLLISGSVSAGHPQPGQMNQVKQLAHQLEIDATQAHREAERYAHHGDYREQQALANLHRLEESAEHFHNEIESNWQNPSHTEDDFIRLNQAYAIAQRTFRDLHAYSNVQSLFERMTQTLGSLNWFYSQVDSGPGYPGGGNQGREIQRIAHEVETAAAHVHRRAEQEAHYGDTWTQAALRDLHQLEQSARHFHQQTEAYWNDPRHTHDDFRQLRAGYARARRSVGMAHFSYHVMGDFNRVEQLLGQLSRLYSGSGHGGAHPGGPIRDHRRFPR